jgi:hypothetical protein
MPLGAGFNARIDCQRGEGGLLNLETANYRDWLDESGYGDILSPHDLFLVTGTYMTKNWEAATFVTDSTSLGGGLSVEAMNLADGHFSVDWSTCNFRNKGFNTGHSHHG